MAKTGPILIIEDDIDDQELVTDALHDIGVQNELIFFGTGKEAFDFLKATTKQFFIILCDINLPFMTGLEFKTQVDNDDQLRKKSVPFIFFSTTDSQQVVTEAFTKMTVQGFFQKGFTIEELKESLRVIINYWKLCKHPNGTS